MTRLTTTQAVTVRGPLGYRTIGTADILGTDPDGGRWVIICEDHDTLVNVDTKAQALGTSTVEFCDYCAEAADARDLAWTTTEETR